MEGKCAELDFFINPTFSELKLTLDAEMKHIGRLGVGTKKKQAEVISVEKEEQLWSIPTNVTHYNWLYFVVHSGKEHRNLRANPMSNIRC